jgi:hypothetical protein
MFLKRVFDKTLNPIKRGIMFWKDVFVLLKIDDDIVKELYDQKITTHVSDLRCWK